ncbi:MAG: OsmC family protein [Candidatus Delongbacteria bacterium]|jgi:putative redox protein|nr:OsmC family protein [Candidatus Delongbacteria bacterium]
MKVSGKQIGYLSFDIQQDGHHLIIDADKKVGGEGKGPSPKGLLISGLIGCSGMDVASILRKMHIEYNKLELSAETEYTEDHPKVFKDILIKYNFEGDTNLDTAKIKRAVELSMTKYCGVTEMLKKNSDIQYIIYLNGEEIHGKESVPK